MDDIEQYGQGRDGAVILDLGDRPLLTPAFRASCSSVMFICVLFDLILSPISKSSSSFMMMASI
jgi:hypothetical protein